MTSETWYLIGFYAFCAITIAWLLRRYRRRQRSALSRGSSSGKPPLQDGDRPSEVAEKTASASQEKATSGKDRKGESKSSAHCPPEPVSPALSNESGSSGFRQEGQSGRLDQSAAADSSQTNEGPPNRRQKLTGRPEESVANKSPDTTRPERHKARTASAGHAAASPVIDKSSYLFGPVTPALAALLPETETRERQIRRELMQAGYLSPVAYENLAAIRYVAAVGTLLLFGVLLILVPRQMEIPVLVALVAAPLAAWALPRFYVSSRAKRRRQQIELALPDMLDMLNMCVSQGLGVLPAMRRIAHELRSVYPDLADELLLVCHQAQLGSLELALKNLKQRIDSPDVQSFANLLIQTERMGTSISDALTDYSDTMRETIRQRADQKANQASFKLMFPTALCLMPAVFLFLLGPAIVELNNFVEQGGTELFRSPTETIEQIQSETPRLIESQ